MQKSSLVCIYITTETRLKTHLKADFRFSQIFEDWLKWMKSVHWNIVIHHKRIKKDITSECNKINMILCLSS